jgi:fused signal recognition particle receptor
MFDKLKKAFSSAAKGIGQKEISEKVLDDTLFDLEMSLLESDVAQEAVESLSKRLKTELLGMKLEKGEDAGKLIQSKLQNSVAAVFAAAGKFDLVERIKEKKSTKQGPYTIVFLGINGTGKTTTVAKIANLIRKNGLSVVVAAGDTHRAGAIEQLTQHANKLSLKVIAQRYGADPSAVGRDAVEHARKNHIDAVLVDTAGRMQTSKNLMDEMAKIVRVVKPDSKLFIGDALAGNDTINQAREFFQYSNFDGAVLTKIDADAKGGAAISIAHITSKPIVYVGVGQGYDDIIPFEPDKFIESLFGKPGEVSVEDLMSSPRTAVPAAKVQEEPAPSTSAHEPEPVEEESKPAVPISAGIFAAAPEREIEKTTGPQKPKVAPRAAPVVPKKLEREEMPPAVVASTIEELKVQEPLKPKVEPQPMEEEKPVVKEEKKSRFGLFKKKSEDEKKKEEERKRKADEQRTKDEEERSRLEEEERQAVEKEKEETKKRKEDKDTGDDKVIYLTDEDIEDLLK